MLENDRANLLAILDATSKIIRYTSSIKDADEFYKDEKTFDAVLMNFIIVGETVNKLSDELKVNYNHINWSKIKGFRNIIAHNYFGVDAEETWELIHKHILTLVKDVNLILNEK